MSLHGHSSESIEVDPNLLVGAWLDSFGAISDKGMMLNRGRHVTLPPVNLSSPTVNCYPPTSSSAASWDSDARGSSTHGSSPKSPRLLLNPATAEDCAEGGEESGGICVGGRLRGGAGNYRSRGMAGQPGGWRQPYGTRSAPATPLETADQGPDTDIAEGDGDTDARSSIPDSSARSSYAASLTYIAMPPPKKRKSSSLSPSKASSTYSDTRRKRQALYLSQPAGSFGIPDLADHEPEDAVLIPADVIAVLSRFSTGNFEIACVPRTAEIDALLRRSFPHERIPAHARLEITDEGAGPVHALELVNFAIETHRACLRNSRVGEDEAAWYPLVRSLLSIEPPAADSPCAFARPPRHASPYRWTVNDLFITIDATTKSTAADLAPQPVAVKVDALVAFNGEHRSCKPTVRRALAAAVKVNAFADTLLAGTVVALAVEVKATGGAGGEMEAEYQLGVWGMKTLNLMKRLAPHGPHGHVLSVSVCGHVWSLHVTYWRGGEIVTHGPVSVGATDTLYGTLKVVAFVKAFKEWARDEVWAQWKALVEAATGNAEE